MKQSNRLGKLLYFWVNLSFLVPIVYLILRLIFGSDSAGQVGYHTESDYLLILLQCLLGLAAILIASLVP